MADAAIKSARGVFEIMEFFDRERRPLGLKAICDQLGYPVSSGAAMLKSLVTLGYLEYDRKTQTYLPTMRRSATESRGSQSRARNFGKCDALALEPFVPALNSG